MIVNSIGEYKMLTRWGVCFLTSHYLGSSHPSTLFITEEAAMAEQGKSSSGVRVCVTGSAGFIGSWLVKKLLERGYTVHATLRNTGAQVLSAESNRRLDQVIRMLGFGIDCWPQVMRRKRGCCGGSSPARRSGCDCSMPTSSTQPLSRRQSPGASSSSSSPLPSASNPPAPRLVSISPRLENLALSMLSPLISSIR
jgi:hypothetical protein